MSCLPVAAEPRSARTLLVVDGDADRSKALDRLLSHEGYRVERCASGRQALDWLRTGRPDLIVLDLPATEGAQFREAQKADPALSAIPVVALSGGPVPGVEAEAHLKRSFHPETLVAAIGDLVAASDQREVQSRVEQGDRLASLGTLAAGVAHEINNPLAHLMLDVDHARERLAELAAGPDDERLHDVRVVLDRASEAAERIRGIVRGLKTFSRPDREAVAPLRVVDVLEATLRMAGNEIRLGARLVKEIDPVPMVLANEGRLGQVFLNLLLNALQALPDGRREQNEIRVVVRSPSVETVVVEFHDNGVGIPVNLRARIFEPFFTTKPVGVGTGLGLSVCHGIVTSFGGALSVKSEVGSGSVFRVELPAVPSTCGPAESAEPRAVAGDRPSPPVAVRGRILVVDDEPGVGSSLGRLLTAAGDVVAVTSAGEALERILSGARFDVILCDLMMPGMDGPALHDEVCKVAPAQAARMIFMTGGAFSKRAIEFLERVPNERVDKPFDVPALRALVRAMMPRKPEPS